MDMDTEQSDQEEQQHDLDEIDSEERMKHKKEQLVHNSLGTLLAGLGGGGSRGDNASNTSKSDLNGGSSIKPAYPLKREWNDKRSAEWGSKKVQNRPYVSAKQDFGWSAAGESFGESSKEDFGWSAASSDMQGTSSDNPDPKRLRTEPPPIGELENWGETKRFEEEFDPAWLANEHKKLDEEYGEGIVTVKYTDQGTLGYYCILCFAITNSRNNLATHCSGMKHLKKKDIFEKDKGTKGGTFQGRMKSEPRTSRFDDPPGYPPRDNRDTRMPRNDHNDPYGRGPPPRQPDYRDERAVHEYDHHRGGGHGSYDRHDAYADRYQRDEWDQRSYEEPSKRFDDRTSYQTDRYPSGRPSRDDDRYPSGRPSRDDDRYPSGRPPRDDDRYPSGRSSRDDDRYPPGRPSRDDDRYPPGRPSRDDERYPPGRLPRDDEHSSSPYRRDQPRSGDFSRNPGSHWEDRRSHSLTRDQPLKIPSPPSAKPPTPALSIPPSDSTNLAGGPSAALLRNLAQCSVKNETDSELASSVIDLLLKSLKDYNMKIGEKSVADLMEQAEIKLGTARAIRSVKKPGAAATNTLGAISLAMDTLRRANAGVL